MVIKNMNGLRDNPTLFLWHAFFLALAKNFMDMNIILPAMVIDAGGNSIHIGILTAIMTGGVQLSLLLVTPFLSRQPLKKGYLLAGINIRVLMLAGMASVFYMAASGGNRVIIWTIILLIAFFAASGAFANIAYVDILGKSISTGKRKPFFSMKQMLSNTGVLLSAYLARLVLVRNGYPANYRILFFSAAALLATASVGFWMLTEKKTDVVPVKSTLDFIKQIKSELWKNNRLKNYILLWNTQGVLLVMLPFMVLFSKTVFHASGKDIGNYLIFKVIGGVLAGLLVYLLSKRVRYRNLLYFSSGIAFLVSLLVLTGPAQSLFPILFFLGGIALTLHLVCMEGILLELSSSQNRVLVTGLVGAANLLPGVFAVLAGWIIQIAGLRFLFVLFGAFFILSLFFVYKLNCEK